MLFSCFIYCQLAVMTVLYTAVTAPVVLLLLPAAACKGKKDALFRFFVLYYGKCAVRLGVFPWIRVRFEDRSGTGDAPGICVFNHRSASDPFLVSSITSRPPVQIVNDWPMRLPFFGLFAKAGGYLDVKNTAFDTLSEKVTSFVRSGTPVAAFPEGTRSGDRSMNPFHGGVFRIAKKTGLPLIPVAVAGNESIPTRSFVMHRGLILIRKLAPVPEELVRTLNPYLLKRHTASLLLEETRKMDRALDRLAARRSA